MKFLKQVHTVQDAKNKWFRKEPKKKNHDVHTNEGELKECCLFAGQLNGCLEPFGPFFTHIY